MDSSVPEFPMELMSSESSNLSVQQYSTSITPMELMQPISSDLDPQSLYMSHMQLEPVEEQETDFWSQQFLMPSIRHGEMKGMPSNVGSKQLVPAAKRKASVEIMPSVSKHSKHTAQMEHRPWLQQLSTPSKMAAELQSSSPASVLLQSQQSQRSTPKNQGSLTAPSPKMQNNACESVRSKMRESLIAALALVSQQQGKSLTDDKNHQNEAETTLGMKQNNFESSRIGTESADGFGQISDMAREAEESSQSRGENVPQKIIPRENPCETFTYDGLQFEDISFDDNFFAKDDLLQCNGLSWVLDSEMEMVEKKEIQSTEKAIWDPEVVDVGSRVKEVHSSEDVAFKIEAELFSLFGGVNKKYKEKGRSLLFNLKDRNNPELRERVMSGEITPERLCSMTVEELASKELSQWRVAKAEELAQMVVLPEEEIDIRRLVKKTHKGEYQVEVDNSDNVSVAVSMEAGSLSESQASNKEMEGSSPGKADGIEDESIITDIRNDLKDKGVSSSLRIQSHEGTDSLQRLMVDDSLKDTEFLPPIISLDEFIQSLQSEPSFESLPVDVGKSTAFLDYHEAGAGGLEPKSSGLTPIDNPHKTQLKNEKSDESSPKSDTDLNSANSDVNVRSNSSHVDTKKSNDDDSGLRSSAKRADVKNKDAHVKSVTVLPVSMSRIHRFWGGSLQFNISTSIPVVGIFISGEKTVAKEWPSSIEIKGRVRLDAFEKFVQGLPLSRSRAFMVLHFDLKEGRTETQKASLHEITDSYVLDERVGFAEVTSGVEIYFCPLNRKTLEMVKKIVSGEQIEALNAVENGLIGVVVRRKPHLTCKTSLSPNSSSHHKRTSSKRHLLTPIRPNDPIVNATSTPKQTQTQNLPSVNMKTPGLGDDSGCDGEDNDDVPPGFGPGAAHDEDDLPEFNFPGDTTPPAVTQFTGQTSFRRSEIPQSLAPPRQVDQIRELIFKYGQSQSNQSSGTWQDKRGTGVAGSPWNDDDDDIPEWEPQALHHQVRTTQSFHNIQQQHVRVAPQLPPQLPVAPLSVRQGTQSSGSPWQQRTRLGRPIHRNEQQNGDLGYQTNRRQFNGSPGMSWRPNAPRNRGI